MKKRIAIGADGAGTTFEEIRKAHKARRLRNSKIVLLFTNKETCGAVEYARRHHIPIVVLRGSGEARETQLLHALTRYFAPIDLICLAGYLRLVPQSVVDAFPRRIINSHPALDLVRFGGKGMYGTRVTAAEIEAGIKKTGSTIHFVDEEYDAGDIILQTHPSVSILPNDTAETLLTRKLARERELYIRAIQKILSSQK
jgi:phosphoribosylglycinamide formyltransferase 1